MTGYFASYAWLPTGVHANVRFVESDGRIVRVTPDAQRAVDDVPLPGLVLPGLANTHSHAFHRALRGRTHRGESTFWSWRQAMYQVAARLDPQSYFSLARAVYAEMALAGITAVGEFHYLHHAPGGRRYDNPNEMGLALQSAARAAGIRLTLLDCVYLSGGIGQPLNADQLPYTDANVSDWATRFRALAEDDTTRIGAAIHSVRAVPREALPTVVTAASHRPLHFHLSEQSAENEASQAAYGRSPTELLDEAGALGSDSTAVHATHLSGEDISRLGLSHMTISFCPTTERDLADGIGPARRLKDAGALITVGTDQHAVVDILEEARSLEMHERLASGRRGAFAPAELIEIMTVQGHRSLGWHDAGRIEVGARADLVVIDLQTPRTAGCAVDQLMFAAGSSDIRTVIRDGEVIVQDRMHKLGDVGQLLREAIEPLWQEF